MSNRSAKSLPRLPGPPIPPPIGELAESDIKKTRKKGQNAGNKDERVEMAVTLLVRGMDRVSIVKSIVKGYGVTERQAFYDVESAFLKVKCQFGLSDLIGYRRLQILRLESILGSPQSSQRDKLRAIEQISKLLGLYTPLPGDGDDGNEELRRRRVQLALAELSLEELAFLDRINSRLETLDGEGTVVSITPMPAK